MDQTLEKIATPTQAVTPSQVIELSNFVGTPYINVMTGDNGIYAKIKINIKTLIKVARAPEIIKIFSAKYGFEADRIYDYFKNGESDVFDILVKLSGGSYSSMSLWDAIFNVIINSTLKQKDQSKLVAGILADLILLATKVYTFVGLDSANGFYHVGYTPNIDTIGKTYSEPNSSSGITAANDYFLMIELKDIPIKEMTAFYSSITDILVSSKASFSPGNEDLIVDFMGSYSGKLIRSLVNEADKSAMFVVLFQIVFLASYINQAELIYKDGDLVSGNVTYFASKGLISSDMIPGIKHLSEQITGYLRDCHQETVLNLESAIGAASSQDIIGDTLMYLSAPIKTATNKNLQAYIMTLLETIIANEVAITGYIK